MGDQLLNRPLSRLTLLLAVSLMVAAVIPHFWHIQSPVLLFFLATAATRLALHQPNRTRLRKWLVLPILVAGIAIVYSQYPLPVGARPGVAYLVTLFGLKILEASSRRDIYVLTCIAFFVIATQYLFENGLLLTLYLTTVIVLLVWMLTTLNRDKPETAAIGQLKTVATIIGPAIPVTLLLFYLFPRLASPLWELRHISQAGVTGLSDSISLGSISQLSQSNATAFRVSFGSEEKPPQEQLYWRGPVLWETDGKNWTTGRLQMKPPTSYRLDPERIEYEVVMEANRQPWLFALDLPATIPDNTQLTRDFRLIADKPVNETLRYTIESSLTFRNNEFTTEDIDRARQLPETITGRVRKFARNTRQQSKSDKAFVQSVLNHFNREPFVYTLRPPALGENPVDAFLFESRRGFCEHYATSFVTLMRAAGVPARIVTGYQGGEYNPIGNYLRVRQSDAHAWAEVWIEDEGWVRIDPTAAVAPERVERTLDLTDAASDGRLLFRFNDDDLLSHMAAQAKWLVDTVQLNWKRWIVNFDQKQQKNMLSMLGLDRLSRSLLATVAILVAILSIGLFALFIQRMHRDRKDPAIRQYECFSRKLAKIGLGRHTNEGPLDYLRRISERRPELAGPAGKIIRQYVAIRYRERGSKQEIQALSQSVRRFSVR